MQIMAPVAPGEGVLPKSGDMAQGALLRAAGSKIARERCRSPDGGGRDAASRQRAADLHRQYQARQCWSRRSNSLPNALRQRARSSAWSQMTISKPPCAQDSVDAVIGIGGTGSGTTRPIGDRAVARRKASVSRHRTCAGRNRSLRSCQRAPGVAHPRPGRCRARLAGSCSAARWLRRLAGGAIADAVSSVRLARKVTSTIGIAEFVPLRRSEEGAKPLGSGFLSLQSLAQADGWMLVPAESEGYPAGTEVTMRPLP